MNSDLETLYRQIEDIETAMMTTRRADGHLESRAMATQKLAAGADLWFVTLKDTAKTRDLQTDPHVNLSYYKDRTREWVSISGIAALIGDRAKIEELYEPDWKFWFPSDGDERHGTPADPRLQLVGVEIHEAVFLKLDKPQPVILFELVKSKLSGETPELGETRVVRP